MNPLVILLILGAAFGSGAYVGYEWLDGRIAKEQRAAAKAAGEERDRLADVVQAIGKEAAKDAAIRANERITWQQRLKEAQNAGNLVSVVCPNEPVGDRAGGDQAAGVVGSCAFTGEFVRLWDDAMLGHQPAPADPAGVDDGPGRTGATAEDALENVDANGGRWAKCRSILKQWQQYGREAGWVK
jgi:hypothetical protein